MQMPSPNMDAEADPAQSDPIAELESAPSTDATHRIDHRSVGQSVEQMVERVGPQLGSSIASWLKQQHQFEPKSEGYDNLSHFLGSCAPRLERFGKAGADVIWGVHEQVREVAVAEPLPHRLWRAIASPNSERSVVVLIKPENGEWRIQPASDSSLNSVSGAEGEWKRIAPLSAEGHRSAALAFLQRPEVQGLRAELESVLHEKFWWLPWTRILNSQPGLVSAWYAAREGALRNHVRDALVAAGLEGSTLAEAVAYPAPTPPSSVSVTAPKYVEKVDGTPRALSIRELVLRTIDQMDDGQLRELRLPAGSVLDALRRM